MLVGNEKLNADLVKSELKPVFERFGVKQATLFGSVAKGNNSIDSDVDIVVESELKGFAFLGLIESIREMLNKKVDILKHDEIIKGSRVDNEIKNTGLLIYG